MVAISKKTVLIVGDQKRMTSVVRGLFTRMHPGFGHVCVSSFVEARDLMREMEEKGLDPFSLIITSANIPIAKESTEKSTMAFRFVIKECDHRGIGVIVFSEFDQPGGFEGRWVKQDRDAFGSMRALNSEFRLAMGMS